MKALLTRNFAILVYFLLLLMLGCGKESNEINSTFNSGSGTSDIVYVTGLQQDGKILIGGGFISYNGDTIKTIARLNANGSLDKSFNPGTGVSDFILSIALQPNGKIIIGGPFYRYNGISRRKIARLNIDGSLDNTFDPGTGADGFVYSTILQRDGKIIIGGGFTNYNDVDINRIARLNSDGSLDNTFNPGTGPDTRILSTILQRDGKIIIGGNFFTYNGIERKRIARLNVDGSLDNTFNPGTGANGDIRTIAIQTDGKIVIGGSFTNYNGSSRNHIARLNADGSLDNSFSTVPVANDDIRCISILTNGKIIIGGPFATYDGSASNRIARLNADGSLDNTFNPTAINGTVNSTSIQPDGKIIIGGDFPFLNGRLRRGIARLNSDGTLE